jgi:hypothetical protein
MTMTTTTTRRTIDMASWAPYSASPHRGPAELAHQPGQPTAGATTAGALCESQDVENGLGGDAFDAVTADSAPEALERWYPRVSVSVNLFGLLVEQSLQPGIAVSHPPAAADA